MSGSLPAGLEAGPPRPSERDRLPSFSAEFGGVPPGARFRVVRVLDPERLAGAAALVPPDPGQPGLDARLLARLRPRWVSDGNVARALVEPLIEHARLEGFAAVVVPHAGTDGVAAASWDALGFAPSRIHETWEMPVAEVGLRETRFAERRPAPPGLVVGPANPADADDVRALLGKRGLGGVGGTRGIHLDERGGIHAPELAILGRMDGRLVLALLARIAGDALVVDARATVDDLPTAVAYAAQFLMAARLRELGRRHGLSILRFSGDTERHAATLRFARRNGARLVRTLVARRLELGPAADRPGPDATAPAGA